MMLKQKIKVFRFLLFRWYRHEKREFPWRLNNLTPFEYIIAEILLQRTKAETVAKHYGRFLQIFSNWNSIHDSQLIDLENALKPVGLYKQRAGRIKLLATAIIERNELIPSERSQLDTIPYMGQYIANSVELIIFNKPMPLLDSSMERVIHRVFSTKKTSDLRYNKDLQTLAKEIVNHRVSKHLNWAILDFAAKVCKSRNPKCTNCHLNNICDYFKKC